MLALLFNSCRDIYVTHSTSNQSIVFACQFKRKALCMQWQACIHFILNLYLPKEPRSHWPVFQRLRAASWPAPLTRALICLLRPLLPAGQWLHCARSIALCVRGLCSCFVHYRWAAQTAWLGPPNALIQALSLLLESLASAIEMHHRSSHCLKASLAKQLCRGP